MSQAYAHDVQKEVKGYLLVFAALAFLTIVTVAISYLHLNIHAAVAVALLVAIVKGSLVACYFMHLISERKLIYSILILTSTFFAALFLLPLLGRYDPLAGTAAHPYSSAQIAPAEQGHQH